MDQRGGSAAQHRGTRPQGQAQRSHATVAIAHLQQTCGEVGACHGILGAQRQRTAIGVGGLSILALQQQDPGERRQNVSASRRGLASLQQQALRLVAFVVLDVQARQIQFQIDAAGRERETFLDDGNRLAEASGGGELTRKLLEGRKEGRPARDGATQSLDRFGAASGAAKRRTEKGFDAGIIAAARHLLQRRNRLARTVLRHQGMGQDRGRDDIGSARSQDIGCDLLGLAEPLRAERQSGTLQ